MVSMKRTALAVSATALSLSLAAGAFAQAPPPAPGGGAGGAGRQGRQGRGQGGPGGGGFGRGGQGFGMRGGMGRGEATVGDIPTNALESALKITPAQKTKIDAIKDKSRADMRALFQGGGAGGPGGGRPDPQAMQGMMTKVMDMRKASSKEIEGALTAEQKAKLPALLKDVTLYRSAGLPVQAIGELKLTADQKKKIGDIAAANQKEMQDKMKALQGGGAPGAGGPGAGGGNFQAFGQAMRDARQAMQTKVQALLTADQKKVIEKYPQRGMGRGQGGPGGAGGPGGGRGGRGGRGGQPGQPGQPRP